MRILNSVIISSLVLFDQSLLYAADANGPTQEFQVDVYVRRNQWGQTQESIHQVMALNFALDKAQVLQRQTNFVVEEKFSKQTQVLQLNKNHIFYPQLFGKQGHREFNLPICDARETCDVELFIFTTSWQSALKPRMKFSVKGTDSKTGKEVFFHEFPELENKFHDLKADKVPRIQVHYREKDSVGQIVLQKESAENLLAMDVKHVDVIFQWRASSKQVEYSEHQQRYKISGEEQRFEFQLPKDPYYFGALLFYEKNGVTFESKMEIINKADEFYRKNENN